MTSSAMPSDASPGHQVGLARQRQADPKGQRQLHLVQPSVSFLQHLCALLQSQGSPVFLTHITNCTAVRVPTPPPSLLAIGLGTRDLSALRLSFPIWNNSHFTGWCEDQ